MKSTFLEEGDVIELKKGMKVYANIPEHFVYENKRGCFDMTRSDIKLGGNFDYLCGEYIVYKTSIDGGGSGMFPNDTYSGGHHVFCVKADDQKVKIDFYQSGSFTAMITDVVPIGRAELKFEIIASEQTRIKEGVLK